jgi:hypothetical protein
LVHSGKVRGIVPVLHSDQATVCSQPVSRPDSIRPFVAEEVEVGSPRGKRLRRIVGLTRPGDVSVGLFAEGRPTMFIA